jgi:hypothetical protein
MADIKRMYICMYVQYIQGLSQSRLSTADHALLLIAPATTAVYSLEGQVPVFISSLGLSQQKTPFLNNFSTVIEVCLPRRCIETALLLLCAFSFPQEPVYRVFT